jgi:hypothetical protein
MSASALTGHPGSPSVTSGTARPPRLLRDAAPLRLLGAGAVEDPVDDLKDSLQFTDTLLRRYEAPYPLPWHHGGLNE